MFKFLKEKLKSALDKFSSKAEADAEEDVLDNVPLEGESAEKQETGSQKADEKLCAGKEDKPEKESYSKAAEEKEEEPDEEEEPGKEKSGQPKGKGDSGEHRDEDSEDNTKDYVSSKKKESYAFARQKEQLQKEKLLSEATENAGDFDDSGKAKEPESYKDEKEGKVAKPEKSQEKKAKAQEEREEENKGKEKLDKKVSGQPAAESLDKSGSKGAEQMPEDSQDKNMAKEQPETAFKKQGKDSSEKQEAEKKGFFSRFKKALSEKVSMVRLSEEKFDELFFELEVALLESNVALEAIDKIKEELKERLVENKVRRGKIKDEVISSLRDAVYKIISSAEPFDFIEKIKESEKPAVILFLGVNGSGKTTTIAKLSKLLISNGLKPVIAASDTFRAAAIQQLQLHAEKLGVKMIKHDYGSDPAAVAFDAVSYAKAHSCDAVFIDSAGRLHSNANLMDELKKIARVAKPDMKIFVGEAITGNDCVEQAKAFDESISIDAIILTKADVDEKGGAAVSISYVTKKPIIFIGTGQEYDDIEAFNAEKILESLGL